MKRKLDFLGSIRDHIPQIFFIDGVHYYLGKMIYRECTSAEIGVHTALMQEYARLTKMSYEKEPKDYKTLAEYYTQMTSVPTEPFEENEDRCIHHKQSDLIDSTSDEGIKSLLCQRDDYAIIGKWSKIYELRK